MSNAWGNEIELLLACARREMDAASSARAREAVSAGVEWTRFIAVARAHRLVPLTYAHARAGHFAIPDIAAAALGDAATAAGRRSLLLAGHLATVIAALDAAGVRVLPLKGPLLARELFGDVSRRQMVDLDFLLDGKDLPRAMEALAAAGYRPLASSRDAIVDTLGWRIHHREMVSPAGICVELHWRLLDTPRAQRAGSLEALLPRAHTVTFGEARIAALPAEELFVYLCLHGAGHAWSRLQWVADIAQLLRDRRVQDWDRARAFASALGGGRRVDAAQRLAAALFPELGDDVPGAAAGIDTANARVIGVLASTPARTVSTARERFEYLARTDANAWRRVHRAAALAFQPHPADVEFVKLPRWATPLYAAVRPIRLAAKAVLSRIGRQ